MAQNLLIDTSVILEGGEEIIAKLEKVAPVFVTDIVLQELDGHKNNANSSVAYRAREFFRRLGNSNGIELEVLPLSGMRLEKTDTLRKMFLGAIPLHVIVRKPYKSRDINDSKIIEVAKDYNMTLVTLDTAQRVRGLSEGANVETLTIRGSVRRKKIALILFSVGLFCSILGLAFAIISGYIGQKENSVYGLIFCFPALLLILIASILYPKVKVNGDENFDSINNSKMLKQGYGDILSDPAYCSVSGNTFHSED